MMERRVISTEHAPAAVGPYSQAIRAGDFVYTAGQVALDPVSGAVEAVTIEDQTRQVLANLQAVLEAADSGLDRVVKMTIFITDMGDFSAMNAVYAEYFPGPPPARSTVEVSALPLGVAIEMEAVAVAG
jgi:2-iminobutanoate/2-iminopropanoate deaminase